ncbi:agamous-like MADS-box protein AGL11 [Hordeum vulgare subsp. vulgare]|uniref:agamous-like MADS-box protein AGL11 n=1 Tax=Hordeum vulgare subsp. vulgare TaxID=112509 RepID=UPI001D1A3FD2|nr:agamous-like MADS-box protein AGL11 [Hordeum vulgare subsp. vulgare]
MAPKRKGGNGRKKIAIQRIEKEEARHVCFSKRRQGLFTKATELSVMCGAEVAVVAFSPGGKGFSFGHPSAEAVIDRFLAGGAVGVLSTTNDNELKKLHLQHGELRTLLKEMKERKEFMEEDMAKERAAGDQIATWLNPELGDMQEEDITAFTSELMVVRSIVSERVNQVLLEGQNIHRMLHAPAPPLQQLFDGSAFEFGFAPRMDMHHMLMAMPPPLDLAYEMDMQQILMPIPPPSRFDAGMEMQQMVMALSPQPEFATGIDMQQMIMAMSPLSEFSIGMEMPPPTGTAAGTEMVQQGPGPNMRLPY